MPKKGRRCEPLQFDALRSEGVTTMNRRKNGDYWKYFPDLEISNFGTQGNINTDDDQEKLTEVCPHKEEDDVVGESLPQNSDGVATKPGGHTTNLRKYHRNLSEPSVGFKHVANSRIKRTTSATEIRTGRTRLLCPKGLLIATEPPTSGQTYRQRSNTDISPTRAIASLRLEMTNRRNDNSNESARRYNPSQSDNVQKEKESIFLELESVKCERDLLQKENRRLREELENRNKVIDHLTDYMNSNIPSEEGQFEDGDIDEAPSDKSKMNSYV